MTFLAVAIVILSAWAGFLFGREQGWRDFEAQAVQRGYAAWVETSHGTKFQWLEPAE